MKRRLPIDSSEIIRHPLGRVFYRAVQPLVERWMGFPQLGRLYDQICSVSSEPLEAHAFAQTCLEKTLTRFHWDEDALEALQAIEGPIIMVANHPYGCIDSMLLIHLMESVRPGHWRLMSNRVMRSFPELSPKTILVDPFSRNGADKATNMAALKESLALLRDGGVIGLFAARRVSGWSDDLQAVCDLPWSEHPIRLAEKTGAALAVIHFTGKNSDAFLKIPPRHFVRRSLQLSREVVSQTGETIGVTLAKVLKPDDQQRPLGGRQRAAKLRAWCYLGSERVARRSKASEGRVLLGKRPEVAGLGEAMEALKPQCLLRQEPFALYCVEGKESPALLEAIGRGREITFQAIGAGSGNAVDLTPEDAYYHHLVVWDEAAQAFVGAYRIGFIDAIRETRGPEALYLNHIFRFAPDFFDRLGPAMELSRSFILPYYQKHPRVLDLLWRGLAEMACREKCATMFGSVTISASFSPLSQAILVETLRRRFMDDEGLAERVAAPHPFKATTTYHSLAVEAWERDAFQDLNRLIEDLEGGTPIPPLMRYYISLGARFLSFNVEPTFNDAIYCLLHVSLAKIPDRYRNRFFGDCQPPVFERPTQ